MELLLRDVRRPLVPPLSEELFKLGASGLQEDHPPGEAPAPRQPWDDGPEQPPPQRVWLRAWFEDPDTELVSRALTTRLDTEPIWSEVADQDWEESWKSAFPRLELGWICIAPPWDASPDDLIIEPGQGFGTGQHATTRGILARLPPLLRDDASCLDVGCGSGVLALAAARGGMRAVGIDIDADALANAAENARLNGLEIELSDRPLADFTEPFDLVLANLFAERLVQLADDLVRLAASDLVLAGVLADREDSVRARFDPVFGSPQRDVDGEWICLHYRRAQ